MSGTYREKRTEFEAAALKALVGKPWGVREAFTCPLCGGKASVRKTAGAGDLRADCRSCRFGVYESGVGSA